MKKSLQQLAWAIIFGLGIPGLILGVAAEANRRDGIQIDLNPENTVWEVPLQTQGDEGG